MWRDVPEHSSGLLHRLYLCRHQTERKNIHIRGNEGRVRGVEEWRVDCFSETANLELCNRKKSSCQNTNLMEFKVLSVFAKYPSQKDVSKRGRRDLLPYAQYSQYSGKTLESFRSGGVCMVSGAPWVLVPWSNTRRAVRSTGNVFIFQTFRGFASHYVAVGGVLANIIRLFYICFDSSCFVFLLWKRLQPSSCHF